MSSRSGPSQAPDPLTIGNVVSAAIRLYRDHFKTYFFCALIGYLWLVLPVLIVCIPLGIFGALVAVNSNFQDITSIVIGALIALLVILVAFIFGYVRFAGILGQISRLAYQELISAPESARAARTFTRPRDWTFFWSGCLMGLILVAGYLVTIIALCIVIGIPLFLLSQGEIVSPLVFVLAAILGILALLVILLQYIWLYSRYSVYEVAIAVEPDINSRQAIARSWQLTGGYVWRILGVFLVAFLVSIPVSVVTQIILSVLQGVLSYVLGILGASVEAEFLSTGIYVILVMALSVVGGAFVIPFWQSIKAVIYYDLRGRKEGLGLEMRSH